MEKYMTCEDVAERYSVEVATVWGWIRRKKLGAIKAGKVYRITQEDIRKFEEEGRTM